MFIATPFGLRFLWACVMSALVARPSKAPVEAGTLDSVVFFVSTIGSDSGKGTKAAPFQSLHGAQAAVRALGKGRPAVTVYVRGVRYAHMRVDPNSGGRLCRLLTALLVLDALSILLFGTTLHALRARTRRS